MENATAFDMSELFCGVSDVYDTPMQYVKMVIYKNNTTTIVVLNKSGQLNYYSVEYNTILPIANDPQFKLQDGEMYGGLANISNNYTSFINSWYTNSQKYNDIIMS